MTRPPIEVYRNGERVTGRRIMETAAEKRDRVQQMRLEDGRVVDFGSPEAEVALRRQRFDSAEGEGFIRGARAVYSGSYRLTPRTHLRINDWIFDRAHQEYGVDRKTFGRVLARVTRKDKAVTS